MKAHNVDMGDVGGGPGKTDGKDGDGKNGRGNHDVDKDGGGWCKTGDHNPHCNAKNGYKDKNGRSRNDKGKNGCGEDEDTGKNDRRKNGCGDGGESDSDSAGYDGPCLPDRPPRKFLPLERQAMALLSMAVPPEDRGVFEDRFRSFKTGQAKPTCPSTGTVCRTSAAHIAGAYGCDIALPLHSAVDMFPSSGTMSSYLSEIYVMDVILNRSPFSEEAVGKSVNKAAGCDDDVLLVRSYCEEDLHDDNDYKFRTMILFLPQCGVFYCARERRQEDVGVARTLVALDMSWLRLQRRYYREEGKIVYTFGEGGYVKRFYQEGILEGRYTYYNGDTLCYKSQRVSAWRLSLNRTTDSQQDRVIYRVRQCLDEKGPKMAPDVIDGVRRTWKEEYLALEYNRRLATTNSARRDGRHYAQECHHSRLPQKCWVINPTLEHFIDIMVDLLPRLGRQKNKQSVVMVRNVNFLADDGGKRLFGAMACITKHNKALRLAKRKSAARSNAGDYGTMHAIGTHVHFDGVTIDSYAANACVGEKLLRKIVVSLAKIGRCAYPQVYAVIRGTEENSGLQPVSPMDGEGGRRVENTVDVSVDLGNTSHVDVHNGSQGYSVWGEDPGRGTNWFLVLPNVYGLRPDPDGNDWIRFEGLAIRITDGVSVSWDGRDIRQHCTSLSEPDGPPVGEGLSDRACGSRHDAKNHLYGTFTAVKKRVVEAGRKLSAAMSVARAQQAVAVGDLEESAPSRKSGKNRRKKQKNKKRSQRGRAKPVDDDAVDVAYCKDDDNGDGDDDKDDDDDNHRNTGVVPSACCDYRIPKRTRR